MSSESRHFEFKIRLNANLIEIDDPGVVPCRKKPIIVHAKKMDVDFSVNTLEGPITGKAGDYLMFGIDGEKYPCDKDIFERTYDIVEEEKQDD